MTDAQFQTDLLRSDRRNFDVEIKDRQLIVQLRRNFVWQRRFIFAFLIFHAVLLVIELSLSQALRSPSRAVLAYELAVGLGGVLAVVFYRPLVKGESWTFQKEKEGFSCWREGKSRPQLLELHRVQAWRKGQSFRLALETSIGRLPIGTFNFGKSEAAWRTDAAQIASFLEVPLSIPPV